MPRSYISEDESRSRSSGMRTSDGRAAQRLRPAPDPSHVTLRDAPVADADMAMSRSATGPGHPVGRLVLPDAAAATIDERLEGQKRPELELVLRVLPRVARLAGGDEILDPVGAAAGKRDHMVQGQWPGEALKKFPGTGEVLAGPAPRSEFPLPCGLVQSLAHAISPSPLA